MVGGRERQRRQRQGHKFANHLINVPSRTCPEIFCAARALTERVPIPFDIAFKLINDNDPKSLVELLIQLSPACTLESCDRELNVETTRADHLYLVHEPSGKSLIHMEAYTAYRSDWAQDQIRKAAQITLKYWLPLRSLVIFLTKKRVPKVVPQELSVDFRGFQMKLKVDVVRLWEIPARKALDLDSLALCPWTVLMDSTEQERTEAENRIVASGNRELGLLMAIFAGLRYGKKREVLERFDQMFTAQDLMESSFVRDTFNEGKAEGHQEGRQEGRQEGMVIASAASLRRILIKRFGPVPQAIEARIASAPMTALEAWLDRTIDARSLDEVFAE